VGYAFIGPAVFLFVAITWTGLSACLREVKVAKSDGEAFEFEDENSEISPEEEEIYKNYFFFR
jgi:hypothetical protein